MRQKWSILKVRACVGPSCYDSAVGTPLTALSVIFPRQGLVAMILVFVVAMPMLRPRHRTLVIREMGADGEWVRDHQLQDDLSQEELGIRARAILGRKPTALESGKGLSNFRNRSENQPSPSEAKTNEDPTILVVTEGEVRSVEKSSKDELVENTYPKFKVTVVSGRYLAEVRVNNEAVSGTSLSTHTHHTTHMACVCAPGQTRGCECMLCTHSFPFSGTSALFCCSLGFSITNRQHIA